MVMSSTFPMRFLTEYEVTRPALVKGSYGNNERVYGDRTHKILGFIHLTQQTENVSTPHSQDGEEKRAVCVCRPFENIEKGDLIHDENACVWLVTSSKIQEKNPFTGKVLTCYVECTTWLG